MYYVNTAGSSLIPRPHPPMKEWPGIHRSHMCKIIVRVFGTVSVNVSVNGLSHVGGVVWRQHTSK